jgi:hypothetical protein
MNRAPRQPNEAFQVIVAIAAVLVIPAAITLRRVAQPGVLQVVSDNPTPFGYTWSLLLFIVPIAALVCWFLRRPDLDFPRKAFLRTLALLTPSGFALDLLFGNGFFTFSNKAATLGISVPGIGGPIPVEEFVFYSTGFALVLLSYLWADEYWVAAYNIPDYKAEAKGMPRIVRFHFPSVILGLALITAAVIYKKFFSGSKDGFPSYFSYIVLAALTPSAGFFHTAKPFINWRAFGFTCFLILLISLLWEVTLALPYGWWGFRPQAMMGLTIGAWFNLPIEEICVWFSVSFTTIIIYEVMKIWIALGVPASKAFFGV